MEQNLGESEIFVQGLELDESGRIIAMTMGVRRMDYIAEQENWATSSDKKASEWVDNMNHLGGKAMDNAGVTPTQARVVSGDRVKIFQLQQECI